MSTVPQKGWYVGTVEAGFDGVWSQPEQRVAVYHDGEVVKSWSGWYGTWLATLLARIYVWRHR